MKTLRHGAIVMLLTLVASVASLAQSFTVEQIKGYPFPNELTVSAVARWKTDRFGEKTGKGRREF